MQRPIFTRSLGAVPNLPLPRLKVSASVRADLGPLGRRVPHPCNRDPAATDPTTAALPKGSRLMASTRLSVARAFGTLALAAVLVAPASAPRAADADPVVARVNGVDIRQSDLALAEEEVGPNMPQMSPDQKR